MAVTEAQRETIKCRNCELIQFRTDALTCRRCARLLFVTPTAGAQTVILTQSRSRCGSGVRTMRDVMQVAAVEAVRVFGGTTKAAQALEIPHSRVKQLLRETGDDYDYRKGKKARRQRCTNRDS